MITKPRLKKRNLSTSKVNTRSNKEQHKINEVTAKKTEKRKIAPVTEADLETPEQKIDDVEENMTD